MPRPGIEPGNSHPKSRDYYHYAMLALLFGILLLVLMIQEVLIKHVLMFTFEQHGSLGMFIVLSADLCLFRKQGMLLAFMGN